MTWISIKDKLPDADGRYLITEKFRFGTTWVGISVFRNKNFGTHSVVAWKELPKPYEEDK
jgi:hypothetical protein